MSAQPKIAPIEKAKPTSAGDKTLMDRFNSRSTKELVIAFAGPIGCGIGSVIESTKQQLLDRGYEDVVVVKLSDFLAEAATQRLVVQPIPEPASSARFNRYRGLQEIGRSLRSRTNNMAILAEYAMQKIAVDRGVRTAESTGSEQDGPVVPKRVAYLIDQVKRPEEVALLRAVYRNAFYLIGVTRVYERRVSALRLEAIKNDEIHRLMEIDRLEAADDGQKLDKTLYLSDYFIRNDSSTVVEKIRKIDRALDLIHGDKSITPTDAEQGMYAAYAAGLRSACLSRQVGASIAAKNGEILATGCNDVPKAGGGLYSASSPETDMRCVHREEQHCFNDFYKQKLQAEIGDQIGIYLGSLAKKDPKRSIELTPSERGELIGAISKKTRLKDLIEFSRSVHAEMDAIVSVGRKGGGGLIGATLYTTTFPCHSCARHIVAAGIMQVVYIEPYEKSMARELHDDAIVFDVEEAQAGPEKVSFLHFEGVSPRQFQSFFRAISRKDDFGKVIKIQAQTAEKTIPEYLDNYQAFETKAIEHLDSELREMRKQLGSADIDKAENSGDTTPQIS